MCTPSGKNWRYGTVKCFLGLDDAVENQRCEFRNGEFHIYFAVLTSTYITTKKYCICELALEKKF